MKRNVGKKYYKYKIENLLLISKIVTIHYFELKSGFRSVGESHDFWEMVYADKGTVICERDDERVLLGEGEVIFHKPNEYHTHLTPEDAGASIFIISFVCKSEAVHFFENKKMTLGKELLKYIYMLIEESRITFDLRDTSHRTKRMPLLANPALGGTQAIKNLLELLLITIMRREAVSDEGPSFILKESFDEYITNQVIEYLSQHIHGTVRVEDICRHLNYTKSYLFRQFKAVTGQSIMTYFVSLKIKEAKRLLRESELSVTEIAGLLAFDTPNYFSKTFKRVSGYTPIQYKKMVRIQNR